MNFPQSTPKGCSVAGLLLTGGTSRRMGFDKASMLINGVPCATRVAEVMQMVVADVVEVGPGITGLPAVEEEPVGSGPLAAVSAGARAIKDLWGERAALVLACDLPLVTQALVRTLVEWPGNRSAVPVIEGRPQPLCARWSAGDLAAAQELVEAGARSMRSLLDRPNVELIGEDGWPGHVDRRAFSDVDTPADLDELAVAWLRPSGGARPATASGVRPASGTITQVERPPMVSDGWLSPSGLSQWRK